MHEEGSESVQSAFDFSESNQSPFNFSPCKDLLGVTSSQNSNEPQKMMDLHAGKDATQDEGASLGLWLDDVSQYSTPKKPSKQEIDMTAFVD